MSVGYIYILSNPSYKPNMLKIGITTREPKLRAYEICRYEGVPSPFTIEYAETVPDVAVAEWCVHEMLEAYRVNEKREFFNVELRKALEIVRFATGCLHLKQLGLTAPEATTQGPTGTVCLQPPQKLAEDPETSLSQADVDQMLCNQNLLWRTDVPRCCVIDCPRWARLSTGAQMFCSLHAPEDSQPLAAPA